MRALALRRQELSAKGRLLARTIGMVFDRYFGTPNAPVGRMRDLPTIRCGPGPHRIL